MIPALGAAKLSEVRRAHVQSLVDMWLGQGVTPSTIKNRLNPLQVIFRRAIHRDQVAVNPTAQLEVPAVRGRRPRVAPADEAAKLLAALPDEDRALWATAFFAGLRRGEIRGLKASDVDLDAGRLHVRRGWDDMKGEIAEKTFSGKRSVPIFGVLRKELVAHKLRTGRSGDDLFFGSTADTPFDPSTVRRRARAAWKRAGLEPMGLHPGRHTAASYMIACGLDSKEVSTYVGHSTIVMTYDVYGHLFPDSGDAAIAKADAYFEREIGEGG